MKELEKIKRISIASTLFILAVLIGVLTFERPKNMYALNTKDTLGKLVDNDYLMAFNEINKPNIVLIDVRNQYEYEKGHLVDAINMPSPEILSEENQSIFNELKDSKKTVVIYGKTPEEANIPFLMLYQLGFENVKLLSVDISYLQNKLVANTVDIEKPVADIKAFLDESIKNSNSSSTVIEKVQPAPKKIITVKKKKKKPVEGGC
jgi:rhodanese-related sulfurtransferase